MDRSGWAGVAILASVFVLTSGCGLKDIRPASVLDEGVETTQEKRGRRMIDQLATAHGGMETFRAHRTARIRFVDTWHSWVGRTFAMPWSESGLEFEMTIMLGSDNSRLEFVEGERKGQAWGIQHWATYRVPAGGEPKFEQDDTIKFWLPTIEYFFEAPFRLQEATVVYALSPGKIGDATYDRVFLSWNTDEPQEEIDQYIAWIDRSNGRLAYLRYTVRDMMGSIEGCMAYRNYEEVGGIWVAKTMAVVEEPGGPETLHRMDVKTVEFGVDVEESYVVPRPGLQRAK